METCGLPLLLVTSPTNIFYLTGFRGSAGVAVFGPAEALLWVDPRYTLQAHEQARGVEVIEEKRGLLKAVAQWLRKGRVRRAGYEPAHMTCADFERLAQDTRSSVKFEPSADLIEELREVKDDGEIAHIRKAGRVTAEVFEEVIRRARPGVSESDLAAEIDYQMRKKGGEGAAFEAVVASGARGALPHARASAKLLEKDELVIVDLGAILGGYAADMTRTIALGKPTRRARSLYNAVLGAQGEALATLGDGVRAKDVDSAARRFLARRGVARYFTHSTGHGVGLEVHERPRLARGERARVKAGCVVTVEPGIYLEGWGGIRLEDTVWVRSDSLEILTPASKEQWVVA